MNEEQLKQRAQMVNDINDQYKNVMIAYRLLIKKIAYLKSFHLKILEPRIVYTSDLFEPGPAREPALLDAVEESQKETYNKIIQDMDVFIEFLLGSLDEDNLQHEKEEAQGTN